MSHCNVLQQLSTPTEVAHQMRAHPSFHKTKQLDVFLPLILDLYLPLLDGDGDDDDFISTRVKMRLLRLLAITNAKKKY